jgi:hypothetical protein
MPAPMALPPGDTVTLKSGKSLTNVQVLKTTLTEVHIQTLINPGPDLPPLVIPRQFVESVEYDNYDPNVAAMEQQTSLQTPGLMSGFEVSKDMGEKLNTKITPPLSFQNRDLVDVLAKLSKDLGVTIEVSDEVKALTPQARLWTFESADDITLSILLQEKLPEKFPELMAEYQFDRIIVKSKLTEAPEETPTADAPASAAAGVPAAPAAT